VSVAADLQHGDALVCVTDGVTERHEHQRFLEDELPGFLSKAAGETASGLAEWVESVAREFVAGEPRDDMAVLVLRVPPE
jgi:serine phosphatase RsbU (regulator of sigma subunit)